MKLALHVAAALFLCSAVLLFAPAVAHANGVGRVRFEVPLASAAERRSDHQALLDATAWYPTAADPREERRIDVGPSGHALLEGGMFVEDALPTPGRHPLILLSHGFGGSSGDLAWLGRSLAARGFIVLGVDHPGNNPRDRTPVGSTAWWERPRDLIAAARALGADPRLGAHVDLRRVGAAGFSMGGMTALALGGAIIDPGHFDDFCAGHPPDKVCDTAPETPDAPHLTQRASIRLLGLEAAAARAGENTSLPGLRAILAISPPAQMLDPASIGHIKVPTTLVVGDLDDVVPGPHEAGWAARRIAGSRLVVVPGVAHYSFVGICTEEGRLKLDLCRHAPRQERAHEAALHAAIRLFTHALTPARIG